MKQVFSLHDCHIKVLFDEHSIHITNDSDLWQLIDKGPEATTRELAQLIRKKFSEQYGLALAISEASLVVEIWGHVYFEYLALVMENLIKLKLMENITTKMVSYCEVIDCGESGYDSNRKLWDMLAPFTSRIAGWLPKGIDDKNLKGGDALS